MKARRGQVAVYLVLVLVGLCVMLLMNVGIFVSVRMKNRVMNAADAAALATARVQGNLLNVIGSANIEHLKAAIKNQDSECHRIVVGQMQDCFLGPIRAISESNRAVRQNLKEDDLVANEDIRNVFRDHIHDVRMDFVNNPDLFPPPYDRVTETTTEGCTWEDYAQKLELAITSEDMLAVPENAEFTDDLESFPLLSRDFYSAIEGQNWCWFKTYGHEWVFDCDSHSMPDPFRRHTGVQWNSEVYSLHLRFASWQEMGIGFTPAWTNMIRHLTGCTEQQIAASTVLTNELQVWAFYDSEWRTWHEVALEGNRYNRGYGFPAVGKIRPEYDVKGALVQCRVCGAYDDLLGKGRRTITYKPMAKPFGSVENLDGDIDKVTAFFRLVTPAFTDVRLVPVAQSGWDTPDTGDAEWRRHVKELRDGLRSSSCSYCRLLEKWDNPSFRQRGVDYLRQNACDVPGEGDDWGGAPYGY